MEKYINACRICLKEDGIKIPIFGEEGQYRSVVEKIKECLNLPIYQSDPLPKQICNRCYYKLDLAFELKAQCQRTNAIFVHSLSTMRGNQMALEYLRLIQDRPLASSSQPQKRKFPEENAKAMPGPSSKRPNVEEHRSLRPTRSMSTSRESPAMPVLENVGIYSGGQGRYPCQECDKVYSSRSLLQAHDCQHNKEQVNPQHVEYSCHICGRSFEQPKSLKMHSIKYHKIRLVDVSPHRKVGGDTPSVVSSLPEIKKETLDNEVSYDCSICFQMFDSEEALNVHFQCDHQEIPSPSKELHSEPHSEPHSESYSAVKPECVYCFQTFKNKMGLVNHLRTNHGKPSCNVCLEIFNAQEELLKHRSTAHKGSDQASTPPPTPPAQPRVIEEAAEAEIPSEYTCDKCGKSFEKYISFIRHKAYHTKMGPAWIPSEFQAPKQAENSPDTATNSTAHDFQDSNESDSGSVGHTVTKVVGSTIKSLNLSATKLSRLVKNSDNTPFCCYCKKIYEDHKKLWDHIRKVHPSKERYKCPHNSCNRVFFTKRGYKSHLGTHKDKDTITKVIKPVEESSSSASASSTPIPAIKSSTVACSYCPKSFSNANNLRRHVVEKHVTPNGIKCAQCLQVFTNKEALAAHSCPADIQYGVELPTKRTYIYPRVLCRYCPKYLSKKYIPDHEKVHRRAGHKPLHRSAATAGKSSVTVEKTPDDDNESGISEYFKKKKAVCRYCNVYMKSFEELRTHLLLNHAGKVYFLCDKCPEVYYEPAAIKAHNGHHNRPRTISKCRYCERPFTYFNRCVIHEKSCTMRYKKNTNAASHPATSSTVTTQQNKTSSTQQNSTSALLNKPAVQLTKTEGGSQIYTCTFCGSQFLETHAFITHLQAHAKSLP